MTAPITPDERAAMRARYPAGPIHESGLLAMGMRALDDVPRLLGALDAAEAEVARMVARPAPAWDEEATRVALVDAQLASVQQVMEDGYPSIFVRSNEDAADAALAVVREHLPVKPGREDVARLIDGDAWSLSEEDYFERYDDGMRGVVYCLEGRARRRRKSLRQADAVLDLFPGRSEAEVKAEALREAADAVTEIDGRADDAAARWLRERADCLAAEGGADRG